MLNQQSIEIYTLSDDREKRLWEDCIFVFDTSALLNCYFFSERQMKSIFTPIFPKCIDRLWIPQQVIEEYLKNREDVIKKPIKSYFNLIKLDNDNKDHSGYLNNIEQTFKDASISWKEKLRVILGQFKPFKENSIKQDKHPYFEDGSLIEDFENVIESFKADLEIKLDDFGKKLQKFQDEVKQEISNKEIQINEIYQNDPVLEIIEKYFKQGEEYSFDKIMEIVKEGHVRYLCKIPPGYEDKKRKKNARMYGDLIIWKQIIDYAKNNKKNIILINDDLKEDWWDKKSKGFQPRQELIKEFHEYTGGMEIWMYTLSNFIYKAGNLLNAKVDQTILEEVKEIEKEQLKQEKEEIANILVPRQENVTTMPSYHHPQEQDYWQEEIEVENSIGQRQNIRTNLLRVYPESFNTYDAYMDIPRSIHPDIQKVISPRLGKTWRVIAGPTESSIMGYFRGDYTSNNPPAWVFGLRLNQAEKY